jgi:DNA invertase Pin-like site-specific DNA recombinase
VPTASRETVPHRDNDAPTDGPAPVSSGWLQDAEWRRSHDLGLAIGRAGGVDITVFGASQTFVCAAQNRKTWKQEVALREILLPNRARRQQVLATAPMLLGYARVSKAEDQDTAAQVGALKAAGCTRIYEERASGGRWDRPELHRLLDHLREGDTVVVWKLDRLTRSLKDLLHILEKIDTAGARFRSVTEAIDTSGPAGRMVMQMLGCFAEFERAMVRERTRAGLKAGRERGRKGGRRPKLLAHQKAEILAMLAAGRAGAEVARLFRVHRATISRIAAEARAASAEAQSLP